MAYALATIYDDYIALPPTLNKDSPREAPLHPRPLPEQICDGPTVEEWKLLEEMYWEGLAEMVTVESGDKRWSKNYMPIPDEAWSYQRLSSGTQQLTEVKDNG